MPPLTRKTQPAFLARLERLTPENHAQWGSLTPHRLLTHLRITMSVADRGDRSPDESTAWTRSLPFRFLILRVLPWPKGKIKVPDQFTPDANGVFDEERERVVRAMEKFLATLEKNPRKRLRHPLFGEMTLREWSILHGKHLDHHFRQFGV